MLCSGGSCRITFDDFRARPIDLMSYLDDIPDQLRLSGLGKTGLHVAFDVRHVSSLSLQTCDEVLIVGVAFDKFRKMLAVFDKLIPAALADHEEDIVVRLARSPSLTTRSRPAESARFCSSVRP